MSDRGTGWGYEGWEVDEEGRPHMAKGSPAIGRVTQLTTKAGIPVSVANRRGITPRRPNWEPVRIPPMYMVSVWRDDDQAHMIVNRVGPFSYERVVLSNLEMEVIMDWATDMVAKSIGRFTPSDGGWRWWAK